MKRSIRAPLLLLCAAVLLPAPAAGVYVDFTNQLYGFTDEREYAQGGLTKEKTVVDQVLYARGRARVVQLTADGVAR